MTFKDLSRIIGERGKEEQQRLTLSPQQQREIVEAQSATEALRRNHDRAYHERKRKWCERHGKSEALDLFNPTPEEIKRDTELDEWYWNFLTRIYDSNGRRSPEQRYQNERNPAHGFGHESKVHERSEGRLDKGHCVPACRFYKPTGRLTIFDILGEYRGYEKFEDVWQAYKELEAEGSIPKE